MIDAALLSPLVAGPGYGDLAWFALALLAGRVVLAWLPPGLVGGHALRELPATAGTSFFLGLLFLLALDALPAAARIAGWVVLGSLAIVRLAAAPAAMVPRHEPPLARASWLSRALLITAWILVWVAGQEFFDCRFAGFRPLPSPIFVASAFGAAFLVDHALDVARCVPWVRAAGVLLFAVVLLVEPIPQTGGFAPCVPLVFTAAAASAVAWLRRGDKRALATAVIFFAGTWVLDQGAWPLAVAGALWLVVGSPSPSRWFATSWCAGVLLLALAVQELGLPAVQAAPAPVTSPALSGLVGLMFILVVAARWYDLQQARGRRWNPSGAPRGHEDVVLLRMVITAFILTMGVQTFAPEMPTTDPIRPALLVLTLLSGLAVARFARILPARAAA